MATAAERLSDALTQHQIDLQRFKKGTNQRIQKLLQQADAALVEALLRRLNTFGETGMAAARKRKSLKRLLATTLKQRSKQWSVIRKDILSGMREFSRVENGIQAQILEDSIGIKEYESKALPAAVATAAIFVPFRGRTLNQHISDTRRADMSAIRNHVMIGVSEGQSASDITRGLRGIAAAGFTDGVLRQTSNKLNAVTNSSMNSTSNLIAEGVWKENGIVSGLIWTAILDGRTTPICQSRDGKGVPFNDDFPKNIPLLKPQNARPPAHFNCRSHMQAVLIPSLVVPPHRTAVTTTLTVPARRRNFRATAKRRAGDEWRLLTERQRRRRIRQAAVEFADKHVGRVAPETTYGDWLERQAAKFQDEVLGPTRGRLFRQGGLSVEQFVDFSGRTMTLEQLAQRFPGAFKRAGFE